MWNLNEDTSGRHIIRQSLRLHIEKFAIDGKGKTGKGKDMVALDILPKSSRYRLFARDNFN